MEWPPRCLGAFDVATKAVASKFVAFPAVACANVVNVFLMRRAELVEGIAVTDADGKVRGRSVVAAKQALADTAVTRIVRLCELFAPFA